MLDITETTFYNKSGDPDHIHGFTSATTSLTSLINDETISGKRDNLIVVDLTALTETHYGLDLLIHSSEGPIQVNAGTLSFDENGDVSFVNGPHPFFIEDPNVAVCEILTEP